MGMTYQYIKSRYSKVCPEGDRTVSILFRATSTTVSAKAHKLEPNLSRSTFSQVSLDGSEVSWRVAADQLNGNIFNTQDELTDGADVWVVRSATLRLGGNEWLLVTGKQR